MQYWPLAICCLSAGSDRNARRAWSRARPPPRRAHPLLTSPAGPPELIEKTWSLRHPWPIPLPSLNSIILPESGPTSSGTTPCISTILPPPPEGACGADRGVTRKCKPSDRAAVELMRGFTYQIDAVQQQVALRALRWIYRGVAGALYCN